jgi:hypothetical protein
MRKVEALGDLVMDGGKRRRSADHGGLVYQAELER